MHRNFKYVEIVHHSIIPLYLFISKIGLNAASSGFVLHRIIRSSVYFLSAAFYEEYGFKEKKSLAILLIVYQRDPVRISIFTYKSSLRTCFFLIILSSSNQQALSSLPSLSLLFHSKDHIEQPKKGQLLCFFYCETPSSSIIFLQTKVGVFLEPSRSAGHSV